MTNKIFTYHAATKELQYEDIRLNATDMNLPDEDDGKEFVEGVDFNTIGCDLRTPLLLDRAIPIQKQESEKLFIRNQKVEDLIEQIASLQDQLAIKQSLIEKMSDELRSYLMKSKESEDELWDEAIFMAHLQYPNKRLELQAFKDKFTIKRK